MHPPCTPITSMKGGSVKTHNFPIGSEFAADFASKICVAGGEDCIGFEVSNRDKTVEFCGRNTDLTLQAPKSDPRVKYTYFKQMTLSKKTVSDSATHPLPKFIGEYIDGLYRFDGCFGVHTTSFSGLTTSNVDRVKQCADSCAADVQQFGITLESGGNGKCTCATASDTPYGGGKAITCINNLGGNNVNAVYSRKPTDTRKTKPTTAVKEQTWPECWRVGIESLCQAYPGFPYKKPLENDFVCYGDTSSICPRLGHSFWTDWCKSNKLCQNTKKPTKWRVEPWEGCNETTFTQTRKIV